MKYDVKIELNMFLLKYFYVLLWSVNLLILLEVYFYLLKEWLFCESAI